jgi:cytochrome b involved in lipid metabolism
MLKLAVLAALALLAPSIGIVNANNNNVHVSVDIQTSNNLPFNHHNNHHNHNNNINNNIPLPIPESRPTRPRPRRTRRPVWNNKTILPHNQAEINSAVSDEESVDFKRRGGGGGGGGGAAASKPNPLAGHNKIDNCWIVLNGDTMDITRFDHPLKGGLLRIVPQCGHDVTEGLHGLHQAEYDVQMKSFIIDASTGTFRMDQSLNPLSKDCDKSLTLAARVVKPHAPAHHETHYQDKSDVELSNMLNQLRRR